MPTIIPYCNKHQFSTNVVSNAGKTYCNNNSLVEKNIAIPIAILLTKHCKYCNDIAIAKYIAIAFAILEQKTLF